MNKIDLLKNNIDALKIKSENSVKKAIRYDRAWKLCQGSIALIGILTPLIVVYRKDSFLPQQFWVAWCIATPLLTSLMSFLLSYFDWQGLADKHGKFSSLTSNLIERAENKLAFATDDGLEQIVDWLYDEQLKIETIM